MHPLDQQRPSEKIVTFLTSCLAVVAYVVEMEGELVGLIGAVLGASSFLWSHLTDKRHDHSH